VVYEISKELTVKGHNVTVYTTDGCTKRLKVEKNVIVRNIIKNERLDDLQFLIGLEVINIHCFDDYFIVCFSVPRLW